MPFIGPLFYVLLCLLSVRVYGQDTDGMMADESDNEIDEPIDMCERTQPVRVGAVALKGRLAEFRLQLMEVAEVADDEMNNLMKRNQCDINPRHYRKYGIRELNPRSGKKRNRKLKIPKNKQAKQLLEVSWWLTSMLNAIYEIERMGRLSNTSTLVENMEMLINSLQNILYLMNIKIPRQSSVCYRKQTIRFSVADYSRMCKYGYLVSRDVTCALKHLANTLKRCKKISVRNRRGKKVARLRCKKVKSVFYKKRGKTFVPGCEFRKRLGSWPKIR